MKTNKLTGAALDWAAAKCEGRKDNDFGWWWDNYKPSTDWSQGGPIIEREGITTIHFGDDWQARKGDGHWQGELTKGPTLLIAAMRRYVASKLGDEIEIPKEITR
jgi:hypothetical protein